MLYPSIHIWGDSVGKGVIYHEGRGRYCIAQTRCAAQLEPALGIPVRNHARMGATAPEGLVAFKDESPEPGALIVIEYGGNDCDMPWKEISKDPARDCQGKVPLPRFCDALRAFVQEIRIRGMHPLLVTPPPLDAFRYFRWVSKGLSAQAILSFLGDVQHIYRWQERYSIAVRDIAQELHCPLFDLRDAFLACRRYPQLLCLDGIHPNEAGHAFITQAILTQRDALKARLAAG